MSTSVPTRLRVEHGPRSLGTGSRRPRLSWWPPEGSSGQSGYEIQATVEGVSRSTGPVEDDEPMLRPWPFEDLASRSRVSWRVRVRDAGGWSGWSAPMEFETGLLDPDDWSARFVEAPTREPLPPKGERPALYARRRFRVEATPERARVYATAHGLYELHLDGTRVGDLELTPGYTEYRSQLEVQTYDVTELLTPSDHELVATVSDGWWRGAQSGAQSDSVFGTTLALLAQIEITDRDGRRTVIATDASWEVSEDGPITGADLMRGQRTDQRMSFPPTTGWSPARVTDAPGGNLAFSPAPPSRKVQEYRPISVTRLDARRQVVDLGANINGWVRLAGAVLGPEGNRVRLRHGERLGPDGDVDVEHLGHHDPVTGEWGDVGMVDEVISSGGGAQDFEPRHTTHGFRYVSIEGAEELTARDVTGYLVHTDMTRTGWFRCSDERLNALHEAAVLSFRGNACEVPTDCPTRERAGWTGDWQIFIPTASFLYDVAGFSERWLRDLVSAQDEDGWLPNQIPWVFPPEARAYVPGLGGAAGWGDAAVYVPYQLWRSYGDPGILARQYPSMRAWVEYALRQAAGARHPDRAAARPEPAPHERYLWDTGRHYGEWLEPGAPGGFDPTADQSVVATAYLCRSARVLAEAAELLGKTEDAEHYRAVAARVRGAWQAEFVGLDGTVTPHTQATLTRALAFGLVEEHQREKIAADLVKLIGATGTHVGTGFLATPFLLPVLADSGCLDVAYEVLLQTTPPSWLYMIEQGATTVWESWEGAASKTEGSLNHYSKGAVISFLHEYVAGLRPIRSVPAYRRFEVRPRPGGGITSAQATLDTPYGTIGSAWHLEDGVFALEVRVAPGTEAEITLPDGSTHRRGPGPHGFTTRLPPGVR